MSRTKGLLTVVVGVLCAVIWATPAHAHNSFTGSNPKNGARVAEVPETVTLSFLATLDPAATTVAVTGPDGAVAAVGPPKIKSNKATVGIRDSGGGVYTVTFQVSSVDGHPVKGTMSFTVTAGPKAGPGPTVTPTPTPTPTPATGTAPAATTKSGTGSVSGADESADGTPWGRWAIGGALLIGAAAVGAWLLRRRSTA